MCSLQSLHSCLATLIQRAKENYHNKRYYADLIIDVCAIAEVEAQVSADDDNCSDLVDIYHNAVAEMASYFPEDKGYYIEDYDDEDDYYFHNRALDIYYAGHYNIDLQPFNT